MRLKSFTALTMAEAMQMVRQELGDDAIIVSTQRAAGAKGVRITAALEDDVLDDEIERLLSGAPVETPSAEAVRDALVGHGAPEKVVERLINAVRASGIGSPMVACAAALEASFTFAPLPDHGAPRPFLLVGPPGSGKSLAVAKLAARAVLKKRRVGVISADNVRAGAGEQLAAFTRILQVELQQARGPQSLQRLIADGKGQHDVVFIDSPALNPFKPSDMEYLASLVEAADVEPILVLPAGGDPVEAPEIGEAFAEVGATRLLPTRLDTTRRLGSILAAADAGQMMFCDVSATPTVANGISPLSPSVLARLILPQDAVDTAQDKYSWSEFPQ